MLIHTRWMLNLSHSFCQISTVSTEELVLPRLVRCESRAFAVMVTAQARSQVVLGVEKLKNFL